jgi:hypothetical protein
VGEMAQTLYEHMNKRNLKKKEGGMFCTHTHTHTHRHTDSP